MAVGWDSKAGIWMVNVSRRVSLFLQSLNGTRVLGRMGLPLRGDLMLLGYLCDPSRVPLTYRGLVCIPATLLGSL